MKIPDNNILIIVQIVESNELLSIDIYSSNGSLLIVSSIIPNSN